MSGALSDLKHEPGQNILMFGSATFARTLIHQGLIDELNLLVYPVVLGRGQRLFETSDQQVKLALLEARPIGSTGVILQRYGLVHEIDEAKS